MKMKNQKSRWMIYRYMIHRQGNQILMPSIFGNNAKTAILDI